MKKLFILSLILVLVSCQERSSTAVLSKDEMVTVLGELYIATEMVAMQRMPRDSSAMYLKSIYKPEILEKYQVTAEKFDRSYQYYTGRPEDFYWIQKAVADSMRVKHLRGRINF